MCEFGTTPHTPTKTSLVTSPVTIREWPYRSMVIDGWGRNWVTIGELAGQMCIAHHSAVGLVDRMEELHLVRRVPAREDRRRVHVRLSTKGLRLLEKLYRVHREELGTCGPRLSTLLQQAATRLPPRAEFASPACSLPEIED